MCCPSKGFEPASDPNLADSGFSGVVNTPGVRRGTQSEEERSRGIPGVEDNLVEEVEDNLVEEVVRIRRNIRPGLPWDVYCQTSRQLLPKNESFWVQSELQIPGAEVWG